MKKIMLIMFVMLLIAPMVLALPSHTPTSDSDCYNSVCSTSFYSVITNVFEDNQWKKVNEARSLKDKGFNVVILEDDEDFPVEVIDFNATSIKVKLNPKGLSILPKDIPLRLWKPNKDKEKQFEKDVKDGKKVKTGLKDFKEKMDKVKEEQLGFSLINQEETKTYNFEIGDYLEFGFNSTVIVLTSEVLVDGYVSNHSASQDNVFNTVSSNSIHHEEEGTQTRSYAFYNISSLLDVADITITNAQYSIFDENNPLGANVFIHHIYGNIGGNISEINWTNQPCGGLFDNATACNLTSEDSVTFSSGGGWRNLTISNTLNKTIVNDWERLGMMLITPPVGPSNSNSYSSDNAGSNNPFVFVEYTLPPDITPPTFTNWIDMINLSKGQNLAHDINASDNDQVDGFIVNDTTNYDIIFSTGVLTNITFLSEGQHYLNITVNDTSNNGASDILQVNVSCTANFVNASWSSWNNLTCLSSDLMNQSRNLTESDSNECLGSSNTTHFEYRQTESCDFDYYLTFPTWAGDGLSKNLIENTDYQVSGSTFTIINLDYSWSLIGVDWVYELGEEERCGLFSTSSLENGFNAFVVGILSFLGVLGIIIGIVWLISYIKPLFNGDESIQNFGQN